MQPDLTPIIDEIRANNRERFYAMGTIAIENQRLGAYLRVALGWRKDGMKAENDAAKKETRRLTDLGEKVIKEDARVEKLIARGRPAKRKDIGLTDAAFARFRTVIVTTIRGRAPWDDIEKSKAKEIDRLCASLPVASWWRENVANSLLQLGVIVGEAGNLSDYPKKGHLRKRMGLAPISKDGVVQAASSWRVRGGLNKDDWKSARYSPVRRSRMYVIGDVMIKAAGEYYKIYLARKKFERASAKASGLIVAPAAKIPEKRKDEFVSDGYIHKRAQRYMEQRLLEDLRQAWRRAIHAVTETSIMPLPADEIERKASSTSPKKAKFSMPTAQLPSG